jgi:hypothetical protein
MRLPLTTNTWFSKGYAVDTSRWQPHNVPDEHDETEAYYSRFQIASLAFALSAFTVTINIENLLDGNELDVKAWSERGARFRKFAEMHAEAPKTGNQFRLAIDLLCQFISDRYYPETRSNQRTRIVSDGGLASDSWMIVDGTQWKWKQYARAWDPKSAKKAFGLTPEKLNHAFEALSSQQANRDPLREWYQLIDFVAPHQRDRLRGEALAAVTMRGAASMLAMLHRDLYGQDLGHPNEVHKTITTHMPELDVRADVRRHMEFVVNRFDLNPAPKLTLLVEGASEAVAAKMVFERHFGAPAGTHQIEIVNLGGVDNATGGKKEDRFRAILRLVDYLHHHQTFTFLLLDNENYAQKLKKAAKDLVSTLHSSRHATRYEYIKVWRSSFEFDNFSATEIAKAMTQLANGVVFTPGEIVACKKASNPGAALTNLYRTQTGAGMNKIDLTAALVDMMFEPSSSKALSNRPLIKVLERVARLAARNPFPTMEESWERNQLSRFFGKLRRSKKKTAP